MAGVIGEIATAKTMVLSKYQSSAKFEQVCSDNYDVGVQAFMYNVWLEHPKWDLSFLGEAAREMIVEFNVPSETPLNDPPAEFVPPVDQSLEVIDQPPRVICKDSFAANASGGGGADEDDEVVQIDNPVGVLSSKDHPSSRLN